MSGYLAFGTNIDIQFTLNERKGALRRFQHRVMLYWDSNFGRDELKDMIVSLQTYA